MSLQVAVAWTAFTTLLATLDADASGRTNSRLLLMLPYGIGPAAALAFFTQPLVAYFCEQRRRWTKAKERRAAEERCRQPNVEGCRRARLRERGGLRGEESDLALSGMTLVLMSIDGRNVCSHQCK